MAQDTPSIIRKTEIVKENAPKAKKASVWDNLDVPIERSGKAIVLPSDPRDMPLDKAVEALQRKIEDENQVFQVYEIFEDAHPHDAAVAFSRAMTKLYGFSSAQTETIKTMFGDMKRPPIFVPVRVGWRNDEIIQCPTGLFKLPGVDDPVKADIFPRGDTRIFAILADIKKKDRHVVLELARVTREFLASDSIYKGRAIRLAVDEDGTLDTGNAPTFMNVTDITESDILFDRDVTQQINTNLLVPIKETELCRKHKIPLKRGVLLSGSYGTGKSLTARLAANVCENNGWTFVLLDRIQGLREALEFAKKYSPAVVFAEDIDRIAEIRNESANDLINIIDGVVSKNAEVMVVLTTNFVEKLDPVILRPGRLDAVITLRAPDAETVERLVRYYAGPLVSENEDLAEVGNVLAGQIPASIRECVERAKLGMIGRHADSLVATDLITSAQTMVNHLELLNKKKSETTEAEKLADSLHKVILNGTHEHLHEIKNTLEEVRKYAS